MKQRLGSTPQEMRLLQTPQAARLLEGGALWSKRKSVRKEEKRGKRSSGAKPEAKEAGDEGTVGTRDSTLALYEELDCLGLSSAENHPPVGRWITEQTEIDEYRP